jgi:peroxiredoxin
VIAPGTAAPALSAPVVSGPLFDLAAATARGRAVVVFLRHPASAVTWAALRELDAAWPDLDLADVSLVAVIEGDLVAARDLVPRLGIRFPVICDQTGEHFSRWDVPTNASPWGTPEHVTSRVRALVLGYRMTPPTPRRGAAAFVVDRGGSVRVAWTARTTAEVPPVSSLVSDALTTA